ncbi:MAG: hypothetical protein IPH05_01495 [Flavobacteriales bacterium]|nr:hypothetical protein [Flavobacteriales bacterium]
MRRISFKSTPAHARHYSRWDPPNNEGMVHYGCMNGMHNAAPFAGCGVVP